MKASQQISNSKQIHQPATARWFVLGLDNSVPTSSFAGWPISNRAGGSNVEASLTRCYGFERTGLCACNSSSPARANLRHTHSHTSIGRDVSWATAIVGSDEQINAPLGVGANMPTLSGTTPATPLSMLLDARGESLSQAQKITENTSCIT